jgi:hypothetical protein
MANIVIKKNSTNNIVLTISERSLLSNPYNLIVFNNKFTDDLEKKCVIDNISNHKLRYDEFIIIEKSNADNLEGEVYLIAGEWSYRVYESSIKTLDIDETTKRILETGLVIVVE